MSKRTQNGSLQSGTNQEIDPLHGKLLFASLAVLSFFALAMDGIKIIRNKLPRF